MLSYLRPSASSADNPLLRPCLRRDTGPVKISVVIPAHNAAATVARAILSVQTQTQAPDDIILVDDASDDDTAAIAERLGATTIRLTARQGAAAARNAGVDAATGDVIAFQDADDEWLPDKLARQLPLLDGAAFVACGARLYAEDGTDLGPLYDGQIPAEGTESWRGLLARNTIATPCVLVWRHAFDAVGGFDPALPVAEDQDLWLRLAQHGRLRYLDAPLVRVHRTPISVSGVGTALGARQQMQFTLPMIERHIAANRDRLTAAEIRNIMGGRKLRIGRGACWTGAWGEGARLIVSAMLLGHRPLEGFRVLLATAPPVRWLRGQ